MLCLILLLFIYVCLFGVFCLSFSFLFFFLFLLFWGGGVEVTALRSVFNHDGLLSGLNYVHIYMYIFVNILTRYKNFKGRLIHAVIKPGPALQF